jgi:hypothetical protein
MVPGMMSKTTGSLVEDIHKKEEQVAELTEEWVSRWKDVQNIMKVFPTLRDIVWPCG